jgi:hypothetical protein
MMMTPFRLFRSTFFIVSICAVPVLSQSPGSPEQPQRVPVLLELFTSEGCSSCPPADKLLGMLDRDQPVKGVELIVLSEHVDYWDHEGWKDPYSSRAVSQRQEDYESRLGGGDVYTPQLIIDGGTQVVGSNWKAAEPAIVKSMRDPKIPLSLSAVREGSSIRVHIEAKENSSSLPNGDVYLVTAADHAHSQIFGGENAGRAIDHVAVSSSFRKVGKLLAGSNFSKDVRVSIASDSPSRATRLIAFVQDPVTRRILGSAQIRQ